MAVRQYIGARYVPKFYENSGGTNEWTANTAYEPLTVVTRNGNSYTSKKSVPASTAAPELAPEYWASTGIYNAQIDEYRDEVADVVQDMAALEASTQRKRRYILIGDSYAVGTTNSGVANGWTYYFKQMAGSAGDDVIEMGANAAGFTVTGNTFLDQLNNSEALAGDPESITDIVVAGGFNDATRIDVNDSSTFTTLRNAITAFQSRMFTLYPNATLWISYIARTYSHDVTRMNNNKQAKQIYYEFNSIATVRDLDTITQIYPGTYLDAAETNINHFTQTGYQIIGRLLYNAVVNGVKPSVLRRYTSANLSAANDVTPPASIAYGVQDTVASVFLPTAGLQFAIGTNKPTAASSFQLATIAQPFWGRGFTAQNIMVSGYFRRTAGTTHGRYGTFTGSIFFQEGKLYIKIWPLENDGSSFADLTEVDQLTILGMSPQIPMENIF